MLDRNPVSLRKGLASKMNCSSIGVRQTARSSSTTVAFRKHIVEGLQASLNRLDLEYVDIIYAHRPDRLTPMEETARAFNHVIDKGLAFY